MTGGNIRDEEMPAALRDAIDAANHEDGNLEQVSRLASRLGPVLGWPGPSALASTPAAPAKLGWLGSKIAFGKALATGGLIAGVAGGGVVAYRAGIEATPVPRASSAAHSAAPARPAAPVAEPSAEASLEPTPENAPIPPPSLASAHARAPQPVPSADSLADEARLLKRAGALVGSDASAALAATDEHRRRFPAGALSMERDILAIRALLALGRADDARRRVERFRKAYPSSPHLARFEEALRGR